MSESDEIVRLRAQLAAREKEIADLRRVLDWKSEQLEKLEAAAPPVAPTEEELQARAAAAPLRPFEVRMQRLIVAILVLLAGLITAVMFVLYAANQERAEIADSEIRRGQHELDVLQRRIQEYEVERRTAHAATE